MIEWVIWFIGWSGYVWTIGLIALAVAAFFYLPKIGTHVALILLMVAGGTYMARSFYSAGSAATEAHWQAKLKAETDRRDKDLEEAQKKTAEALISYETERQNNDKIRREISLAPMDDANRVCLAPEFLRKLQQLRGGR